MWNTFVVQIYKINYIFDVKIDAYMYNCGVVITSYLRYFVLMCYRCYMIF